MLTAAHLNRIKQHLVEQGSPSCDVTSDLLTGGRKASMPKYRTRGGMSCPIGCLIEDRFYTGSMEEYSVAEDIVKRAVEKSLKIKLSDSDIALLEEIQDTHDAYIDYYHNVVTGDIDALREHWVTFIEEKFQQWDSYLSSSELTSQ